MVFTAGFVCILLFASILANAGTIISHIVFDIAHRLRLNFLLKKQVMMMIWGSLWAIWMFFMAALFMQWNMTRQNVELSWNDAYWFAYISTTTVGLGDFYPVPEVIFISDLLIYSLTYLFGFVLLSTFLTELGNLLALYIPDISAELGKRLEHVGLIPIPGALDGSRKKHDSELQTDSAQDSALMSSKMQRAEQENSNSINGEENFS